jgi:hypothetical protein
MTMKFNDEERAAMRVMGLPEDIDEFFENGLEYVYEARSAIKDELLGPGLEDNGMDLNPYGEALRSAIDALNCREREWKQSKQ